MVIMVVSFSEYLNRENCESERMFVFLCFPRNWNTKSAVGKNVIIYCNKTRDSLL